MMPLPHSPWKRWWSHTHTVLSGLPDSTNFTSNSQSWVHDALERRKWHTCSPAYTACKRATLSGCIIQWMSRKWHLFKNYPQLNCIEANLHQHLLGLHCSFICFAKNIKGHWKWTFMDAMTYIHPLRGQGLMPFPEPDHLMLDTLTSHSKLYVNQPK